MLLKLLEFSLSLGLEEVVFTLSEEFLLRHVEELLVGKTKRALHFSDLPPELVIFIFNRCEVVNSIIPLLCGRTLYRKRIRLLHENLRPHPLESASESIWLRFLDIGQWQRVMNFVCSIRLSHDNVPFFDIGRVSKICGVRLLSSPLAFEFLQVSIGKQIDGALVIVLTFESCHYHLHELNELFGHASFRSDFFNVFRLIVPSPELSREFFLNLYEETLVARIESGHLDSLDRYDIVDLIGMRAVLCLHV